MGHQVEDAGEGVLQDQPRHLRPPPHRRVRRNRAAQGAAEQHDAARVEVGAAQDVIHSALGIQPQALHRRVDRWGCGQTRGLSLAMRRGR